MKSLLVILLFLALCAAQEEQLRYILSQQAGSKTTKQLIDAFSNQQNEILKKIFSHYINEQVQKWELANISTEIIRQKVHDLVVGRNPTLYSSLKAFVEEKLFNKLDMHLLVQSLQKEIRLNPENYYLTFEVYDLLIDQPSQAKLKNK